MTDGQSSTFPNDSRGDLDRALDDLVTRAKEVLATQGRLRALLKANRAVIEHIELPVVLRKIVEAAVELVGAQYGALGVVSPDGALEQFINVGMTPEVVGIIGHLPEGHGLLGALIEDPHPIRIPKLSDDPRSVGFPAGHPSMDSFLGVPIRVRDEVYGNLYLTDSMHGEFSSDDEELAQALAATAGIAIANARLFEDSLYRERWASALAETARRLMNDEDDEHLGFLVEQVKELAEADLVSIGLVTSTRKDIIIDRAVGTGAADLVGTSFALDEAVAGEAVRGGEPVLVPEVQVLDLLGFADQILLGNMMVIPFSIGDDQAGVLSLARRQGCPPFGPRDLDMGTSFASHISVALDRAEARMIRRKVALLEDRSRIARDLHDHVIQRLFATGLSLQAVAAGIEPDSARRVVDQIQEIDGAIAQIRQSIFALHKDAEVTSVRLRARVLEVVDRSEDDLSPRPRVTFLGPVDLMADATLTDDVTAVVTEALANANRHAHASRVDVVISAATGHVTVEVTDNGVGQGLSPHYSGLANLHARATAHGGSFEVHDGPGGGTQLVWSVPV